MRIVHIVTLVSQDGAYGGPLRVALNQVKELQGRGHHVELWAGWAADGQPPREIDGVTVRLFPAMQVAPFGFSGLYSPSLVRHIGRAAPFLDVLHIHAGRDLVSLSAMHRAKRDKIPYLLQTHGMIAPDSRLKARILDWIATRRLLSGAAAILTLTKLELEGLQSLGLEAKYIPLGNGLTLPAAGGVSTAGPLEVLYCARLHARKRPHIFVEMAAQVLKANPGVRFTLIGPDEGELGGVLSLISRLGISESVRYEGALSYDSVLQRVASASIYVLPSINEPFPMSLLEALSLGVPSICTDTCGISEVLASTGGAVVTDGSVEALSEAVARLLRDPEHRRNQGARGREVVKDHFAIQAVCDRLVEIYSTTTEV